VLRVDSPGQVRQKQDWNRIEQKETKARIEVSRGLGTGVQWPLRLVALDVVRLDFYMLWRQRFLRANLLDPHPLGEFLIRAYLSLIHQPSADSSCPTTDEPGVGLPPGPGCPDLVLWTHE
jgi:hypothetical protein